MPKVTDNQPRRRERPLKRLPSILVGVFLTLYALFFGYRTLASIVYPYPIEYGEGAVLYEVYHISLNDPWFLYKDNSTSPYRAAIYSPLFYYTAAPPTWLLGGPSFAPGRVISVLSALLSGFLIYRAARLQELLVRISNREQRIRLGWRTALCAAVLPFGTAPVYAWGALYKPDMLAVALSLSAIFVVYLYIERSDPRDTVIFVPGYDEAVARRLGLSEADAAAADYRRRAAYITQATWAAMGAGLLCALAFFTKQSALAAPSAIFFFLALRERRLALYFAVAFVGLTTTLVVLFQPLTDGQFFTHVVSYNGQSYEVEWLFTALGFLIGTHPVLLLFSLIYLAGEFRLIKFWGRSNALPGIWPLYFLVALFVTLTVGKVGANLNYYIELLFIASLLSWWLLARLLAARQTLRLSLDDLQFIIRRSKTNPKPANPQSSIVNRQSSISYATLAMLLMFGQLVLLHHIPIVADGANTPGPLSWQPGPEVAATVRQLAARGPMLAEDSGWLAVERIPTDLDDSFVFGQLAKDGQWSQQNFLKELAGGKYKAVMLEMAVPDETEEAELERLAQSGNYSPFPGRFSPEMLAQFKQNFKLEKRLGKYVFLSPKS